jgi:hypothetical protein
MQLQENEDLDCLNVKFAKHVKAIFQKIIVKVLIIAFHHRITGCTLEMELNS